MRSFDLHSEPYAPTGNIGDSGLGKLLGTPEAGCIETLVREAVQNSCDAALPTRNPEVRFALRTLKHAEAEYLANVILDSRPECNKSKKDFSEAFSDLSDLKVMEISDFGTSGLVGPVRADRIAPGVPTDFINFFRNVGTARDTDLGGGTYGFGKVALYLASSCRTILVDTMITGETGPERRIMVSHLGPAHGILQPDGKELRHTGRHWWGKSCEIDKIVDPVCGEHAEEIATRLGLPERCSKRTGTTVFVISPTTENSDFNHDARIIRSTVLHSFWPRMTKDCPDGQKLSISVSVEGTSQQIPEPEHCAPYDLFATALAALRKNEGSDRRVKPIVRLRPRKTLGTLSATVGPRAARENSIDLYEFSNGASHHVALMRPAGFIVKYLEREAISDENLEWAGVFQTSKEKDVEKAFADSEPPSHDNWQPALLPKGSDGKSYVTLALKRIPEKIREIIPQISEAAPKSKGRQQSVAHIATLLGANISANGASSSRRSGSSKRSVARKSGTLVKDLEFCELVGMEDSKQLLAKYSCEIKNSKRGDRIMLEPSVSIGGGQPSVSNVPGREVRIESIVKRGAGLIVFHSNAFDAEDGTIDVLIRIPANARIFLDYTILTTHEDAA